MSKTSKPYTDPTYLILQDFMYSINPLDQAPKELVNECIYQLVSNWYEECGYQCKN